MVPHWPSVGLGQTPTIPPDKLAQLQALVGPGVNVAGLSQGAITELSAAASAGFDNLTSPVKAQILADTGINVDTLPGDVKTGIQTWSRALKSTQGAADAADLIQNGFNPESPGDKEKLIGAIAGGLALIPGAGPLLAGAVETLWQVGKVIACPVSNFFGGIFGVPPSPDCGGSPCTSTGNWTAGSVVANSYLPPHGAGTFADLAIGALSTFAAQVMNCKASWNGGSQATNWRDYPATDLIVDAVVAMWNANHDGPTYPFWIPPLGGIPIIMASGPGDLNVLQAFQPMASGPIPNQGSFTVIPGRSLIGGSRFVNVNIGAFRPARQVVSLHLGPSAVDSAASSAPPSTAPSTGMSTGAKVAVGGAAVGGLALVGTAVYSFVKGQAVDTTLKAAWRAVRGK